METTPATATAKSAAALLAAADKANDIVGTPN